jgi:hypothetical protein
VSGNKLIVIIGFAIAIITMITPNQLSIYASPTTEDDGYTYPDDATEEEKREIDERELEMWQEAGHPGALPYCDKVSDDYDGRCHDRKDYDDITGKAPCNDKTQRDDWRDCPDVSENNDEESESGSNSDNIPEWCNAKMCYK